MQAEDKKAICFLALDPLMASSLVATTRGGPLPDVGVHTRGKSGHVLDPSQNKHLLHTQNTAQIKLFGGSSIYLSVLLCLYFYINFLEFCMCMCVCTSVTPLPCIFFM